MGRMKDLLMDASIQLANNLNNLYDLEVTEEEASDALLSHPNGTEIVMNKSFNSFNFLGELKDLIIKERNE